VNRCPVPRRSETGSRAKPLRGAGAKPVAGVWGRTPSPTPQRKPNKRANSPQGDEASGDCALQNHFDKPVPRRSETGSRAKPLSGCRGEAPAGVWGGTPSPTPQRKPIQRANSPQGNEASGKNSLYKLDNKQSHAAAKPGQGQSPCGVQGRSPCRGLGWNPKPHAAA